MRKLDDLKTEIEQLPAEQFAEIRRWLSEKDWEKWDRELEEDSQSGKLDFLIQEALEENSKGDLTEM